MRESAKFDVVIVGAGIVGSSLALLLAEQNFRVALIEAQAFTSTLDPHQAKPVIALHRGSEMLFRQLNVWQMLPAQSCTPYQKMLVWEDSPQSEIEFDCRAINQANLGHIVVDHALRQALIGKIQASRGIQLFMASKIHSVAITTEKVRVEWENSTLEAQLIIGADGARSWLRDYFAMPLAVKPYEQCAVTLQVKTELTHQKTAWQRFLPTGPLAFLPLENLQECAIVWSTTPFEADRLSRDSAAVFNQKLQTAFDFRLGSVERLSALRVYPLVMRHLKQYVKPRLAFIGDAAHSIHPLAGQGVNLGLMDAKQLADILLTARNANRDIGGINILRRFERARKAENTQMIAAMAAFKNVFSNDLVWLKWLRQTSLQMTNKTPWVKKQLIRRAMGLR